MKKYVYLLMLVFMCGCASGHATVRKFSESPEKFVYYFYQWYMREAILLGNEPLKNGEIYRYVYADTVHRNLVELDRGNYWSDYFLDSQDSNEEWLETIHVYKAIAINDSVMVVPVNFAGDKPECTSLLVFLGKEAGELRIIKVETAVHWSE
ncbi:MAG: YbjP/YqhG family protein [Desulfovibrio sp.]|nr:YbjP/YqhG family protein [Desulfovibrio sp.]